MRKAIQLQVCVCVAGGLAASQGPAFAQSDVGYTSLFGVAAQKLDYIGKDGTANVRGTRFSETLRGNGSRAGYMLTHGGVIPSTMSVSAGGRLLHANADYYLDPANGALFFMEPVARFNSIRVSYRYVEGADKDRQAMGFGAMGLGQGLALNLNGTSLNLAYGLSSDTAKGLDFNVFGMSMNSKMRGGSGLTGLLYMSTPAGNSSNLMDNGGKAVSRANLKDSVSDHLIQQNLNLHSRGANFRASYQDVGTHFSGFQAMRLANAKNADLLKEIGALEQEKGIKRMGFGAGLALDKTSNLGIDWDRIGDGKDSIVSQALGLKGRGYDFKFATRTIGQHFAQFAQLREADKAQLALEKGLTRSDMSLNLAAGKGAAFGFSRGSVQDKVGGLLRQNLDYTSKSLRFSVADLRADSKFARLANLTAAEKTAMALQIRRQFNPNAQAAEVTAKDIEQIPLNAGLNRKVMSLATALGKTGTLGFNQFGISDGKGSIQRQAINLATKGITFNYLDQTIGEGFSRLAGLSDFEKAQFANEHGIHRTSMGLDLALNKTSRIGFSQLSLSDNKGGVTRQSLDYAGKGITFKLNMADTDKNFNRAADLALPEADRKSIAAEVGFKRMDFTASLKAIKGLCLDTYTYQANNATDKVDINNFRHNLAWTPAKGSALSFLTEGNTRETDGKTQEAREHSLLTVDRSWKTGMKLALFHDTLNTTTCGIVQPTVTTDFMHFESNRTLPNNLLAEMKRVRMSDGRFEDTTQFDLNTVKIKTLTLHLNELKIDRGKDPSSDTQTVDFGYKMNKSLAFSGTIAETKTNNNSDATTRSLAVSGPLGKTATLQAGFTEVNQHATKNIKTVKGLTISNTKPISVGPIKKLMIAGTFASLFDQKRKQSEQAGMKVQGMLGKHTFAADYGSTLDPKGVNAVARTLSFTSDPNPKLPVHVDVVYKARNVNHGALQLVRKTAATVRIDKLTTAHYSYQSRPEDAAGNMMQTKAADFGISRPVAKNMAMDIKYVASEDMSKHTSLSKMAASVKGKTDALTAVEVGYSVDVIHQAGQNTDGHTFTLGYDHQIDGDHFITIATSYTAYRGNVPDVLNANVDFRTRF